MTTVFLSFSQSPDLFLTHFFYAKSAYII